MSTLFPTAYDAFVDPGPNDSISTVAHNLNHGQANDAIAGMQAYVGISSSSGQATLTGQIKALQAQIPSTVSQNFVFAGPASGGAGAPAMRALVALDIPWLTATAITSSGAITSTTGFVGPLTGAVTGNVTGNVSGSSGSCTGNAATATTAAACSGNSATATTAAACSGNAATVTGLSIGAFTLTVPTTGTAALLATAQTFTNNQTVMLFGGSNTTLSLDNGTTGSNTGLDFKDNGTSKWRIIKNTTNIFSILDVVNVQSQIIFNAGAVGVGFINSPLTLDASNSTTAAFVLSGGLAVAKSLQVGTSGTFGSTLSATTLTLSGGGPQIQVNAAAANSASIQLNGTTGNDAIVQFAVAGTIQQTTHGNVLGWYLNDNVNGWAPLQYQVGAIGAGDVIFNGTRDATSSVSAGVIMSGGLAVAKQLQVGSTVTVTGSTVPLTLTQAAATSGSPVGLTLTGGAHTTLTSGTEAPDINLSLARSVQFATSTPATQRAMIVSNPTYTCNTASQTIGTAATLAIVAAPVPGTNVTISNSYALWIQAGSSKFAGAVIVSGITNPLNITQSAGASGTPLALSFSFGAHTGLTSGTEVIDANVNMSRTVTWSTTTPGTQRAFLFQAPTYACNTASQTITTAATLAITASPTAGTNVTITNSYALWVQSGGALFAGSLVHSGSTIGVLGATPAAQKTGYGTPTGNAYQASFAAGSITLPNLAAAVAQLILDLKAFGYLGT